MILAISTITMLTSCEKEVEYRANISVINKSDSIVTDFVYKGERTKFIKTFEKINPNEVQKFEINWIGQKSALFGSIDYSHIFQTIEYIIGGNKFNVKNEKDSKIDSNGNYYSEKQITKDDNIDIIINYEGYEIEYKLEKTAEAVTAKTAMLLQF